MFRRGCRATKRCFTLGPAGVGTRLRHYPGTGKYVLGGFFCRLVSRILDPGNCNVVVYPRVHSVCVHNVRIYVCMYVCVYVCIHYASKSP